MSGKNVCEAVRWERSSFVGENIWTKIDVQYVWEKLGSVKHWTALSSLILYSLCVYSVQNYTLSLLNVNKIKHICDPGAQNQS